MTPTALIVDDSLTVRMDLAEAFASAGLATELCTTLREARSALERSTFALVVLDVLLPDGSGIDLLVEIRSSARRAVPILLLSTEAEVHDRVAGLQSGADEYIGKPYDRNQLIGRARDLLRKSRSSEPASDRPLVLVIDDSPTYREALSEALIAAGYLVAQAASGEEGLRAAAALRPKAVIVDGVLPGMDGPSVVRHLRLDPALRRTPCLLLTGSVGREAEAQALDAGADAFVRKEEALEMILARLRAALRGAASAHHVAPMATSLLSAKRILAVDDSVTYLEALGEALRSEGYDVVLASSAEEALTMLAHQPVDCILMDLVMPGMGGREACSRIKAAAPLREIPLLMLTGVDDPQAMIQGLASGADDYIAKSGDLEILRARVRAQIRRSELEAEHRRFRDQVASLERREAEMRAAKELAETRAALVDELERKNRELETFSYSVSHDLRAPLRSIDGFSLAVIEDYGDRLDAVGLAHLTRVRSATQRMGQLIDDLLELSRVGRAELRRQPVDLSGLARAIADELQAAEPARKVRFVFEDRLQVEGDGRLLRVVLENLMRNAWKFSSKVPEPVIELGATPGTATRTFFLRDNGAGFEMSRAEKLFSPFQRLHAASDFPGTGIGLATVHRIIDRHRGRIWAESIPGQGATFCWTLPAAPGGPR